MTFHELTKLPVFGIAITLAAYTFALWLNKKWRFLHPLFVSTLFIIAVLLIFNVSYTDYQVGGDVLVMLLGPATVALGIPLYKNASAIRRHLAPILTGITVGSISAILLSAALVWGLGGSRELMITMMPKSATSPVSLEISRHGGGIPELTAILTVLTGLIGSMFGPALLRWAGVRDDISIGTAMGTTSHGVGTARIIRESELAGSVSGFAMGLTAIWTSVLFVPIYAWLH